MTLSDVLLGNALRARPGGFKLRRQHPSGPYIAGFHCHERRLVIEIDGEAHGRDDRPARDEARDRRFATRNIGVQRIPATGIMTNIDDTAESVEP